MKENSGVAVGCPSQPTADLNNGEWKTITCCCSDILHNPVECLHHYLCSIFIYTLPEELTRQVDPKGGS